MTGWLAMTKIFPPGPLLTTSRTAGTRGLLRLGEGGWLRLLHVALVKDGLGQLDEGWLDVDVGLKTKFSVKHHTFFTTDSSVSPWLRFPKI